MVKIGGRLFFFSNIMPKSYSILSEIIVTPQGILNRCELEISQGRIKEIGAVSKSTVKYNLGDKIVFPALFNSHDHLLGSYYPRVGKGPYLNWKLWDDDLKSSKIFKERSKIPPIDLYLLGAYKNLISGVTTISDHIPHHINDPHIDKLPVRVIKDYALAHEVCSFDLRWGDGIEVEYKKAIKHRIPFITHIEEGFDEESKKGVEILHKIYNAISEVTVMVHGLALSEEDLNIIAKNKANLVWCPSSNYFMFKKTADVKKWLSKKINVCLGTDSPMSGSFNILEEMRFARKIYLSMYKTELDYETLFKMVTINPARAFLMQDKLGSIEKNKIADLLVITGDKTAPFKALVEAKLKDVSLVIFQGNPIYGDIEFKQMFDDFKINYTKCTIEKKPKLIIGNLVGLIQRVRKNVGYKKILPFLPID